MESTLDPDEGAREQHWTVDVVSGPDEAARAGAHIIRRIAAESVRERGSFTLAVSGGHTPWQMFAHLATMHMPWADTTIFQVDERIVDRRDPGRNLLHLRQALADVPAHIEPMPVDNPRLDVATQEYARLLPHRFDLIHLGLGPDGHTASLVPDDAILEEANAAVSVTTQPYQGVRRMSLTYPVLDSAAAILWLVTGAEKKSALEKLQAHDPAIPAGRVRARTNILVCDEAAWSGAVDPSQLAHP